MDFSLILAATDPETASIGAIILGYAVTFVTVALGLGFVIFVHELGHFLVAKAAGVKCEKFYIGFDFFELKLGPITIPRALWKMQWGETEYGIGILPLGGYVKMLGQDDDPRNAAAEAERIKLAGGDPSAVPSDAAPFNPDDVRTSELAKGTAAEGLTPGQSVEAASQPARLDPRSYPAKSVPARMAIISAGVIMNLIFAVVFASIAYKLGIEEIPAIVGGTLPGDPAWKMGLQPGDKVIQIGKDSQPYEHLRFADITRAVVFNGDDRDLALKVRHRNGEEQWYDIRPTGRLKSVTKFPSLGVTSYPTQRIAASDETPKFLQASASPAVENEDKVVAIAGTPIRAQYEVSTQLARHPSGPLTITVERKEKAEDKKPAADAPVKDIEIVVEPKPFREFGLAMQIGPIVAVRDHSLAADAGFVVGDLIRQIDGEPVGDPLSLAQRLVAKAGESVTFVVERKDRTGKAGDKEITVTVPQPDAYFNEYRMGGAAAIEALGVAYEVSSVVAEVQPGSSAEKAGLRAGDVINAVQFLPQTPAATEHYTELQLDAKPITLDGGVNNWPRMHYFLQAMHPETQVHLDYTRDGKALDATIEFALSDTFFDESRGLNFYPETVNHKAATWGEALSLGVRETKERLTEVVTVLSRLLTGRLSATNLSGPAGIIAVAGSAASAGAATMLMFLTMLSANLAVLNFLPIPALDGGHMLFLAAEGIRGKPVDERLQIRLTVAGVLCLLALMVFATFMDINRFFG